ncbi:unnamed protein product [Caenorhabditis sp. 36 PRJEB53466]|nr:unnamed protein product [Caenorhabditis sp. 36 PRJEB53466]
MHRSICSFKTISGWATSVQKIGQNAFVKVANGTAQKPIQVVASRELAKEARVGSALTVTGKVEESKGAQQKKDLVAEQLRVFNTDSNPRYDISADNLRQNTYLRARNDQFAALLRARSQIFRRTHEFFMDRDFIHIDTPKLTRNDCEGGGEVFDVINSSEASEEKTHLTVSSQLHLEAMVSRLNKVYTLGPAFRAEKQQSSSHLSEFHMLEAEVAFVDDIDKMCDLVLTYLNNMICHVVSEEGKLLPELRIIGSDPLPKPVEMHRMTYEEAVSALGSRGQKVTAKSGFSKKNELELCKMNENQPIFITHYPVEQKPFYMARTENGKNTLSFDFLVPGIGELAGGSVREQSAEELRRRGCGIDWYLETRRRGQPPTAGFGIGFERLLQYLLGVPNIKDTIAFPRWHRHYSPFKMVKVKNRYYVIRMLPNDGSHPNPRKAAIFQELMKQTTEMFGDFGHSIIKMSLSVRVLDEDVIVIRVSEAGSKYFGAVLPCIHKIDKQPMVLQTIFIGRSMRSCEKRLIGTRRDELHAALGKCTTIATRKSLLETIQTMCGKPARIFSDEQRKDQGRE